MALSEYTQLEYIESTGSQFIGIDYIPKTLHTKYELGFMRTGTSGYWNPIINSEEDVRFGIMCTIDGNNSSNYGQFHIGPAGSGFKSVQFPISSDIKYDIIADKTGISLNGTKYSVSGVGDATGQWSTYINHRLKTSTTFSPEYSIGRWYYLKVYEDDDLIKDYIPARRKSDNVLGMYEQLEDKFYINSGTGNFIAGPEVFDGSQLQQNLLQIQEELNTQLNNMYIAFPELNRPYIELEYIESTGTQYIDTLIKETEAYMFEFEFTPLQFNGSQRYGSYLSGTIDNFTIGDFDSLTVKYLRHRTTDVSKTINVSAVNKNIFSMMDNVVNVNGVTISRSTTNSLGTGSSNIFILTGSDKRTTIAKIYSLKLYDSSKQLLRDLISVRRKSDNEICMYDKVTKQFFTNQGTGIFIAGPEVN